MNLETSTLTCKNLDCGMYDDCARQLDVREDTTRNEQDERCFYAFCPKTGFLIPNLTRQNLKNALSPKPKQRSSREEKRLNIDRLNNFLRTQAFEIYRLPTEKQKADARKELRTGKKISEKTGINANAIGTYLNLKGSNPHYNPMAQTFYLICAIEDSYNVFEEFVKRTPSAFNLSNEELHRILSNLLEAHQREKI